MNRQILLVTHGCIHHTKVLLLNGTLIVIVNVTFVQGKGGNKWVVERGSTNGCTVWLCVGPITLRDNVASNTPFEFTQCNALTR